jgi:hypothetical protein
MLADTLCKLDTDGETDGVTVTDELAALDEDSVEFRAFRFRLSEVSLYDVNEAGRISRRNVSDVSMITVGPETAAHPRTESLSGARTHSRVTNMASFALQVAKAMQVFSCNADKTQRQKGVSGECENTGKKARYSRCVPQVRHLNTWKHPYCTRNRGGILREDQRSPHDQATRSRHHGCRLNFQRHIGTLQQACQHSGVLNYIRISRRVQSRANN